MIDTHCHILPGMDDGPRSMDAALRMAASAVRDGIQTIIATPHHTTKRYNNTARKIQRRVGLFNGKLKKHNIPLRILPGQEYRLTDSFRAEHRARRLQTLAGSSYLLVELPSRMIPGCLYEFFTYMKHHGIHPVIAHPERNLEIIDNPDQVLDWIENYGVRLQVTTQSLIGVFGRNVQETASYLCRKHWIHLVGSDAHNLSLRNFHFQEGYEAIKQLCGSSYMKILQEHAAKLIYGSTMTSLHHQQSGIESICRDDEITSPNT